MTELAKDAVIATAKLLTHYSFDLGGEAIERLLDRWLRAYPSVWVRAAVIEALYQGRYKAISVEQILALWQRRGQPLQHFNHEFERIVCSRFPKNLAQEPVSKELVDLTHSESFDSLPHHSAVFDKASSLEATAGSPANGRPSSSYKQVEQNDASLEDGDRAADLEDECAENTSPTASEAIQPYKPQVNADWVAAELVTSSQQISNHPIHQFVPAPAASEFHSKLRAVALEQDHIGVETANFAFVGEAGGRSEA